MDTDDKEKPDRALKLMGSLLDDIGVSVEQHRTAALLDAAAGWTGGGDSTTTTPTFLRRSAKRMPRGCAESYATSERVEMDLEDYE